MGDWRWLAAVAALCWGCAFQAPAGNPGDGDGDGDGDADAGGGGDWWDEAFARRQRLVVTTGSISPDRGYAGYTVSLRGFDTAALIDAGELQPDCDDLRLLFYSAGEWIEAARHVEGCGGAASDVSFALPLDLGADATWTDAYLYYGAPAAGVGVPATTDNVYLWWDDAAVDRGADYDHGRMDPWLATGHDDSLAHDPAGYYSYSTGDDTQSSYRRAVDERDVLVEVELFHTGCFPFNMQTGVCVRGIIAGGTGASETSDHYYCSTRAQNPDCADDDQGIYDGDIVESDNETIALQGLSDPPPIVTDQWRKQALAAFGVNPTELRFWDSDDGWSGRGLPDPGALQATGADADDLEGRGFAGLMTAQDAARFRHLVIRRYVEPEPAVATDGPAETVP